MNSPPTTLGKYQIIREIARSNDIVYEAYDPLMHRRVALKELAMPGGATSQQREERIKRFQREGQAAGSLNHPNIMTVYELGQEGDRFFMALEFLDGHTLRNEIDTKGALPANVAVRIVKEVLKGLQFAHDKGVIHRDIKPDNVQLLSNGTVKITDFGIARLTFQPNLTVDGQVFGTPSYMSPEQIVGKEIDARSDLFSVGVMLYEMLSGKKPFQGGSVMETTAQIINKPAERLHDVDYALWNVIERAIEKSPPARHASASKMIDALDAALAAPARQPMAAPPMAAPGIPGFNPYGPASGTPGMVQPGTPFNPYGGQPSAPPPQYPYNPYQQPGAGSNAPHTPGAVPPGLPVWYPPPPKPPLLKPEHRFILGRIGLTALILGTLFFLVWIAVQAVASAVQERAGGRPVPVTTQNGVPQAMPAGEVFQEQANRARELVRQANDMVRYQPAQAETMYQEAASLDPGYDEAPRMLANLYAQKAESTSDSEGRSTLFSAAGEAYLRSAQLAASSEIKDRDRQASATSFFLAARESQQAGRSSQARQYLYDARQVAPDGSEIAGSITQMLAELTGG